MAGPRPTEPGGRESARNRRDADIMANKGSETLTLTLEKQPTYNDPAQWLLTVASGGRNTPHTGGRQRV